jgi:hypothetical protein
MKMSAKLVWIIVCSIGCFGQIFWLTNQYMRYDVNTAVEFMFHDVINLPSISVCGYFALLANWDQLKSHCNLIAGMNDSICNDTSTTSMRDHVQGLDLDQLAQTINSIAEHVPIDSIVNNLTMRVDDFLIGHRYFDKRINDVATKKGYNETFTVTEVLWGQAKCFTLNWKDGLEQQDYWSLKRHRSLLNVFLILIMNRAVFSSFRISVMIHTDNSEIPRYGAIDMVIVNSGDSHIQLKFELFESQILPDPFPTKCLDYKEASHGTHDNRAACYDSCFTEACMSRFNKKPVPMRMVSSDRGIFGMSGAFMEKNSEAINSLSNKCMRACLKQDCNQRLFTISQQSAAYNMKTAETYVQFGLNSMPIHGSKSIPKVNFESFATDVSSTFGFWLGISVFSVFEWITSISKRLFSRSRKRSSMQVDNGRVVHRGVPFRYGPHGHIVQGM